MNFNTAKLLKKRNEMKSLTTLTIDKRQKKCAQKSLYTLLNQLNFPMKIILDRQR